MVSKIQERFLHKICDVCHYGEYEEPDTGQEWHLTCNECGAIHFCYVPLPHQEAFHADHHGIKGFFGGYGSGKTTTSVAEVIDHVVSTPNGTTLMGAATLPQLENTSQKEFFDMFPKELIISYSKQKNYVDTTNGHRVIFRPLDDEGKARSLNLSCFHIEEASEVKYEYYIQLLTRLRNKATDNHLGVISSNPDMGWIKAEILLKADVIHNDEHGYVQTERNQDISAHIAPTHLNTHLPKDFYEKTARGRPDWWVARFLKGSFENREGLVYPQWKERLVDDFDIPAHWKRRVGGDFGLNNDTGFVSVATDPETGNSYAYWTHKAPQQPVSYHAKILTEHIDSLAYNIIEDMRGDSQGQAKTHGDMSSTFDHYAEYGVFWMPATKKLEDSIMKVFTYFELEKLYIFRSCTALIDEISQYRYPERSLDKEVKDEDVYEKPIAVNDHLLDAFRYVIAELPDDPDQLINKSYNAQFMITTNRKKTTLPHALQDDEAPSYSREDAWMAF